ncbi:hypothetical protein ABI59_08630 [Acidobacteria bacterium Mor1]|nr:hypothetical protein ABI59_08630 [Acidobacteria bacterium Mor1]
MLFLCCLATAVSAGEQDLRPGDPALRGDALRPFEYTWEELLFRGGEWFDRGSRIDETLSRAGDTWVRTQTFRHKGWQATTTVTLDARTLAPRRIERRLGDETPQPVLDRLKQVGFARWFVVEFEEHAYRLTREALDGTVEKEEGELPLPLFDASTAGLVLAALPLAEGYRSRFAVAFLSPADGTPTFYRMIARTTGRRELTGHDTYAWNVDVDWAELGTGEISSPGGEDKAGGAYWILTDPPAGLPFVPRYANESLRYVMPDPSTP